MIKIIAIIVVILIAAFMAYAATKPDTFLIQREVNIKTLPKKIFPVINDLHCWTSWSPYEKRDPDMRRTYSGSPSGIGAVYEWEGNESIGKGRMEILQVVPPSKIVIKLDFFKPFEGHNTAEFTMVPNGDTTKVTWAMYGKSSYLSKILHCIFNMDKMIGNDFEAGLANLKTLLEK